MRQKRSPQFDADSDRKDFEGVDVQTLFGDEKRVLGGMKKMPIIKTSDAMEGSICSERWTVIDLRFRTNQEQTIAWG